MSDTPADSVNAENVISEAQAFAAAMLNRPMADLPGLNEEAIKRLLDCIDWTEVAPPSLAEEHMRFQGVPRPAPSLTLREYMNILPRDQMGDIFLREATRDEARSDYYAKYWEYIESQLSGFERNLGQNRLKKYVEMLDGVADLAEHGNPPDKLILEDGWKQLSQMENTFKADFNSLKADMRDDAAVMDRCRLRQVDKQKPVTRTELEKMRLLMDREAGLAATYALALTGLRDQVAQLADKLGYELKPPERDRGKR